MTSKCHRTLTFARQTTNNGQARKEGNINNTKGTEPKYQKGKGREGRKEKDGGGRMEKETGGKNKRRARRRREGREGNEDAGMSKHRT